MPCLSVIVPIYNAAAYLQNSIEKLLNQSLKDIEIILVNDGSSDESLIICEKYANLDSRIILINQENQGVSQARNTGIQYASSEYIVFMDPDDDIDVCMYEILYLDTIRNQPDITLCNYKIINGENRTDILLPYNTGMYNKPVIESLVMNMVGGEYFGGNTVMGSVWRGVYKKSIIINNSITFPLDIRPMQDLVFNINYLLHSETVYINNLCLYNYYVNSNSAITSYKPYMWENNSQVFQIIISMLKDNNLYEIALDRVINGWSQTVVSCIVNEMKDENKKSAIDKINNIDKFLNNPITCQYVLMIDTKKCSLNRTIIAYLLKMKKSKLIYIYFKLKNFIK